MTTTPAPLKVQYALLLGPVLVGLDQALSA